ncbi:hypothetical protein [Blastomonas sp.]|uniref:hypothetical protein n=1 Tax=Blastomonas sp. TaxID=1909299 RepID=UPI00263813B8|nr:hypothetical protein [Blastomonas sp.]MDM7957225.1 hypothetical protein [Blastomonas sp.]
MTSPANDTPAPAPAPQTAAPVSTPPVPTGSADAAPASDKPKHWSRGAINGAGKLISTAANDEMVRNMIGSHARSNLAAGLFGGTIMGAIAARVATRSVPGALLVGGVLLAKAIYDHRKTQSETSPPPKP